MSNNPTFERVKAYFENDFFATCNKIDIVSVTEEEAICRVEISEKSLNAEGLIQGGLIYTLADFAFAVFANFVSPITITQHANISYLRAGNSKNKCIYAKATKIDQADRNFLCKVEVKDEDDKTLAVANFAGFIKKEFK